MTPETLAITWKDADSRDYTDVFPTRAFAQLGDGLVITHDVLGRNGGHYQASCRVTVRATSADLNYEACRQFNEKHGMYLGVLRLHFTDQDRAGIARAEWRPEGRKRFQPAQIEIVKFDLPQMPPYQPMAGEGKRTTRVAKERPGQIKFRALLKRVYSGKCCVTGCDVGQALDGAHIDAYLSPESDHPQNGLLLRKDLHGLFDAGLMAVHPRSRTVFFAGPALQWDEYRRLSGTAKLAEPIHGGESYRPNEAALARRWNAFRKAHAGAVVSA
jgi:hypothetical protein